jgi:uncharacterized membrane protein YphA (DoxX/SURF4 family)
MNGISYQSFEQKLTATVVNPISVTIFCKVLLIFTSMKIVFSAPAVLKIIHSHPVSPPRYALLQLFYFPALLANDHLEIFLASGCLIILISFFLPVNYFSAAIIFWFYVNFYKVISPAANGSDIILTLLLFVIIFLSRSPKFQDGNAGVTQIAIHNTALVLCRIQIAFIYLLSGWDKLQSELWRSGEALFAISKIDYMVNPHLAFTLSPLAWKLLSWCVIIFEILFPMVIWIPKVRLVAIAMAVIFHIAIAIWLSLPDFGAVMIIAMLIFVKDQDYKNLRTRFQAITSRN